MKCEEPPKKPDGDGGRGQEEDDQPMPVDDGGEVGNVDGEEDGDDFTGEGELHISHVGPIYNILHVILGYDYSSQLDKLVDFL